MAVVPPVLSVDSVVSVDGVFIPTIQLARNLPVSTGLILMIPLNSTIADPRIVLPTLMFAFSANFLTCDSKSYAMSFPAMDLVADGHPSVIHQRSVNNRPLDSANLHLVSQADANGWVKRLHYAHNVTLLDSCAVNL